MKQCDRCKYDFSLDKDKEHVVCEICGVHFGNPAISPTGKIRDFSGHPIPLPSQASSIVNLADAFTLIAKRIKKDIN